MNGSYLYEGKKHFATVAMVESFHTIEYQLARQILEEAA